MFNQEVMFHGKHAKEALHYLALKSSLPSKSKVRIHLSFSETNVLWLEDHRLGVKYTTIVYWKEASDPLKALMSLELTPVIKNPPMETFMEPLTAFQIQMVSYSGMSTDLPTTYMSTNLLHRPRIWRLRFLGLRFWTMLRFLGLSSLLRLRFLGLSSWRRLPKKSIASTRKNKPKKYRYLENTRLPLSKNSKLNSIRDLLLILCLQWPSVPPFTSSPA